MKTKFTILFILLTSIFFAQNNPTPFNRIKITGAAKKNNATRIIVQDSITKEYHWILKSSITNTPNLQQVANVGNTITTTDLNTAIHVNDSSYPYDKTDLRAGGISFVNELNARSVDLYSDTGFIHQNDEGLKASLSFQGGLQLKTLTGGGEATLNASNVTSDIIVEMPSLSGSLIIDAPIDGNNYVRKNGAWFLDSGSAASNLDDVLTAGNTSSTPINLTGTNSSNKFFIDASGSGYGKLTIGPSQMYFENSSKALFSFAGAFGESSLYLNHPSNSDYLEFDALRKRIRLSNGLSGGSENYTQIEANGFAFRRSGTDSYLQPETPMSGGAIWTLPAKAGKVTILGTTAPASASSTGVVGEIRVTSTYIYVCTATNTWVRAALATW